MRVPRSGIQIKEVIRNCREGRDSCAPVSHRISVGSVGSPTFIWVWPESNPKILKKGIQEILGHTTVRETLNNFRDPTDAQIGAHIGDSQNDIAWNQYRKQSHQWHCWLLIPQPTQFNSWPSKRHQQKPIVWFYPSGTTSAVHLLHSKKSGRQPQTNRQFLGFIFFRRKVQSEAPKAMGFQSESVA